MPDDASWRAWAESLEGPELDAQRRMVAAELRLGELDLAALRRARGTSQSDLAATLQVTQPNISRIENQDDIRLRTLAHYVAALGGRLELRAVFDDGATSVELLRDPPRRRR